MGKQIIISEQEKRNIQKLYGIVSEAEGDNLTAELAISADDENIKNSLSSGKLEFQLPVRNRLDSVPACGGMGWTENDNNVSANFDCENLVLTIEITPGYSGSLVNVENIKPYNVSLTNESAEEIKDLGLLLDHNEPEDFSINLEYGNLYYIKVTSKNGSTTDFPENWVDGIKNRKWLIQKGTHQYEGTIDNTKDAIKVVQTIVGAEPVDGLFGPKTEKKVMEWQRSNGLGADGKVGPLTLAKMMES